MKKIFTRFILMCIVVSMVGLGCKGLSAEEQASIRPVTLNYWTVFNDVSELRAFADQYSALHTYVKINIRQVRVEEFEKLFVNALAEDVGPDIISLPVRDLRKHQTKLSPMPETVEVSTVTVKGKFQQETIITPQRIRMPALDSIKKDFLQTVVDDAVIGSAVYGLPLAIDTLAIYYNKDLLDKAGVPQAPTTWDQLVDAVIASTKFNNDKTKIVQSGVAMGGANNIQNAPDILSLLIMQNGLNIEEDGVVTFARGLERPEVNQAALQALRFYTDFARSTKETYSWTEEMGNALDEFVLGHSVFYFGYPFDYPRILARAPQMNLAIIEVPQLNPGTPSNVANYWVESVVKKSANQDEAWDFVRFITTEPNIKKYTDTVKRPSPLRAHVGAQKEDEVLFPFVNQILTAKNWYRGRDSEAAEGAFRNLITGYLAPYGERENPLARDAELIRTAARVIQQTL